MTTLREAAQQALEALESLQGGCTDSNDGTVEAITVWCPEVIAALRAALAQEEREPVAWLRRQELADLQTCNYRHLGADSPRIWAPHQPDAPDPESDLVAVYAAQPRREWQGLTDADFDSICDNHSTLQGAARAIEAKLKEKNA